MVHELHSQAYQLGPIGSITVYYALPLSMISLNLNTHKISYSYKILLISWGFIYSIMEWILLLQMHHQLIHFLPLIWVWVRGQQSKQRSTELSLIPKLPETHNISSVSWVRLRVLLPV